MWRRAGRGRGRGRGHRAHLWAVPSNQSRPREFDPRRDILQAKKRIRDKKSATEIQYRVWRKNISSSNRKRGTDGRSFRRPNEGHFGDRGGNQGRFSDVRGIFQERPRADPHFPCLSPGRSKESRRKSPPRLPITHVSLLAGCRKSFFPHRLLRYEPPLQPLLSSGSQRHSYDPSVLEHLARSPQEWSSSSHSSTSIQRSLPSRVGSW